MLLVGMFSGLLVLDSQLVCSSLGKTTSQPPSFFLHITTFYEGNWGSKQLSYWPRIIYIIWQEQNNFKKFRRKFSVWISQETIFFFVVIWRLIIMKRYLGFPKHVSSAWVDDSYSIQDYGLCRDQLEIYFKVILKNV